MRILIDADALVAIAKEDDSNHQKALEIASELKDSVFYITPFTIPEAATVLSYRVSQKAAKEFLKSIRRRNLVELKYDLKTCRLADKIFLSQRRKGTSWIDCLNVAMVKIHKLDGIFSFDRFYLKFKIKCWRG